MKKLIVILIVFLTAMSLSADNISLGTFPVGQWLDPNYDAVWDFSTSNIRILSTSGAVLYDFSTKTVQDFRVFLDGTQPGISFNCPEAGRSYRFIKTSGLNTDVTLEITRSGQPTYTITMKRQ